MRKGSRRASSWLYCVINPIMDALTVALSTGLKRGYVREYVDGSQRPTLRDFMRAHRDIADELSRYDSLPEGTLSPGSGAIVRSLLDRLDTCSQELVDEHDIPAAPCRWAR